MKEDGMKYGHRICTALLGVAPAMLITLLCTGEAEAAPPVLEIANAASCTNYTYAVTAGQVLALSDDARILTDNNGNNVNWAISGCTVDGGGTTACINLPISVPANPAADSTYVQATGTASMTSGASQTLTVTAGGLDGSGSPTVACIGTVEFHVTSSGGGWGDPHLTTVDGVHYDFQSAGEFTALRGDKVEIQTRQSPVPTATVPITNEYTGITHCVSIYTAVAAKFGSTRVTLQPSPGAEPDPKSMQLRVNGELAALGKDPLILRAKPEAGAKLGKIEVTITQHAEGVIEMTDARGMQLVVTPKFWTSQKVWYLNVNVYQTAALQGTMGRLGKRSWLPAMPDGSSLGPKPASENERYEALYEKFADAWRVTDATSLFDYAPGTNTATFTLQEWPRNHPQSCGIAGQTSVQAVTEQVAEEACANVANAVQRKDCTFDVMITGNTGFAKSYEAMQGFRPRGSGWYTPEPLKQTPPGKCPPDKCPPDKTPPPPPPPWCCGILVALGIVQLLLLAFLVKHVLSNKSQE